MDSGWMPLVPVVGGGVVMLAVQVGVVRVRSAGSLLHSWFFGLAAGLVAVSATTIWIYSSQNRGVLDGVLALMANGVVFGGAAYGYFHFVNMGETARRIRILWELRELPDGLSYEEILARYDATEIIQRRMKRLTKTGQIIQRDDRMYAGGTSVLMMAKILRLLKLIFLGRHETDAVTERSVA